MEKQRSLLLHKPTRFVVISTTLSFSFVLLSFFILWVVYFHPIVHQSSYLLLTTPSFSVNFQSLTNLTDTHFGKDENFKGFVDLVANFSVDNENVSNLIDTHLRKSSNASGFVVKSKVNVVEVELERKRVNGEVNEVGTLVLNDEDMKEIGPKYVQIGKDNEVGYNDKGNNGLDMKESESKYGQIDNVNEVFEKKGVVVDECDISKGKWVFDERYPLYTNMTCPFIDEGFNCMGNGRVDNDYMKWRWLPHGCHLPRFNATNMLELIRGKRVVFAGDSINRNQWESLLCLLIGAVKDRSKVYETRGRRITKEKGIYSIRFEDYQCTVEFYVTHFLVHETKARIGKKRKGTLRIDSIDKGSSKWRGADILIFNTGNWWNHFKTKAGINYYQEGKQVHPHMEAEIAYKKALETWATWVDKYIDPRKTLVFFRSTSPAHFRGGQWNNGGHCKEARKPLNEMYNGIPSKDLIAQEVINTMKTPVNFLNVTALSSYRIDGHPSKYGWDPAKGTFLGEDCSHWCLPGVPDAWNELIYYQLSLLKKKNNKFGASF